MSYCSLFLGKELKVHIHFSCAYGIAVGAKTIGLLHLLLHCPSPGGEGPLW